MTALYRQLVAGNQRHYLLALSTLLVVITYVGVADANGGAGFPLDDAWIHQTYARSLVESGRWEYVPGQISTGSTAPLWTLLLSLGYLLRIPYLSWAYLLGGLSLFGLSQAAMKLWRLLWVEEADKDWLAGMAIVFSWPLVWSAASGMETLLFAALGLWVLVCYVEYLGDNEQQAVEQRVSSTLDWPIVKLGFSSGLLILVRPDGVALIALIAAGLSLRRTSFMSRIQTLTLYAGVLILPLIPYLVFNLRASGNVWPNTFYAKQAEYATLLAQPLVARFTRLLFFSLGGPERGWQGFTGAQLLLLPGLLVAAWLAQGKDRTRQQLCHSLPLLWAVGHILLYSWRLPVTYQHGRYLLVTLPVWVIYGLFGWQWLLGQLNEGRTRWLLSKVAFLSFVSLLLLLWLMGTQAYATDVAFIEGEMVAVAQWLHQNTPPDAIVAAHDIGAIGYFARRPLVDLAGLISPEIIPWLEDETLLREYILESDASYLVTAPGWSYENVTTLPAATSLYTTDFEWTRLQGVNNMTVYRLPTP